MFTRRVPAAQATTYSPETRTVTLTASTFTDVARVGIGGTWIERLSRDPADWDFSRIDTPAGAPLLLDHQQTTGARIGRVLSARVTPAGVVAEAQLSQSPEAERIVRDLIDGLPYGASIGYTARYEPTDETVNGAPVRIARNIRLYEISIVPLAADAGAHVRSLTMETVMNDEATTPAPADGAAVPAETSHGAPAGGDDAARVKLAAYFAPRLGGEFFACRAHLPLSDLRREMLDELARRDALTVGHTQISVIDNTPAVEHAARVAIAQRMGAKLSETEHAVARAFMGEHGASVLDIGAAWLRARGERIGPRHELAARLLTRAVPHSTSDFPALLASAANKVMIDAYEVAQSGLMQVASEMTATDFKPISMVKLGEAPKLEEVPEGGEVQHGTIAEAKEAMRVRTFARIFGISRQAIVNDDLGAFSDRARVIGRGAAETIASELAALLATGGGNGVELDDGENLYHVNHNNKQFAAGFTVGALGSARELMRNQKGLDGVTPINAVPRYLVVAPARETAAEQLLAQLYPATTDNVNPFAGRLTLIVEPRLGVVDTAWFWLFADPAALPVIRIAWLNGQRTPTVEVRDGWEVLGTEFRAVLDFGCGIVDHRGTVAVFVD